jgi:hypothetical protein
MCSAAAGDGMRRLTGFYSMLAVPFLPLAPPSYPHSTPNTPSVDISLLALTVLEVFALSEVVKTDRKRKPPPDGAAWQK